MALGVIHMIAFGMDARGEFAGWMKLNLWTLDHWQPFAAQSSPLAVSGAAFWSTLGSCAVPLFLVGYMLVDLAKRGTIVPAFIGWVLLVWMLVASFVMQPSGFPVGVIIAIFLLWGIRRQHHSRTTAA